MAPMDKVGFVKTFGEQIRSVCDVVIRLFGGFKEVETLFFAETCYGLDKFHKSISNSSKPRPQGSVPVVKRVKGMGFGIELVILCPFFDAPKNDKGFIHYKPLKMYKAELGF